MSIYEQYGRQAEQLANEASEHVKTIKLLLAVKAGTIDIERVTFTDKGWELGPVIVPEPEPPDGGEHQPVLAKIEGKEASG